MRFYLRGKCIGDTELKDGSTVLSIQQIVDLMNELYEDNLKMKLEIQKLSRVIEFCAS
jgi:hypothetical protein